MIKQILHKKNHFSKWLLAVSLLFSSLTFSGYVDNLPPQPEQTNQTEQLFSSKDAPKRIISFGNAAQFHHIQITLCLLIKKQGIALLSYNSRHKYNLKVRLNQRFLFKIAKQFNHNRSYPQNSDEESLLHLIG